MRPSGHLAPPRPGDFRPWETNRAIHQTWTQNKNGPAYRSTTQLIRALIDAASKGGNFLLNVGPRPEGIIQPELEDRRRATGKWLAVNGEAIY